MKKYILSLLIAGTLVGCGEKKTDTTAHDNHEHDTTAHGYEAHVKGANDPRVKEVMAIHDSIMPAMSTIMELKAKIARQIRSTDSLLAIKPNARLLKQKSQAIEIQNQLEKADLKMMEWMHQYHADTLEKLDTNGVSTYLSEQKIKIEAVRQLMKESIENAESIIH